MQHLFCFKQRSLSPPIQNGGMMGGIKGVEDRTLQCLFGSTMSCFCFTERWVCVWNGREGRWKEQREEELLPHRSTVHPKHTHMHASTHTCTRTILQLSYMTLYWPKLLSPSPVHRGSPHPAVYSSLPVQLWYPSGSWPHNKVLLKPACNNHETVCVHQKKCMETKQKKETRTNYADISLNSEEFASANSKYRNL